MAFVSVLTASRVGLRGDGPSRIIRESLGTTVDLERFSEEWDRRINARLNDQIPVKDEALTLVQALAKKQYSLAVATSTNTERAIRHLELSGLLPYFECVIGGDKVSKHKPDPEIYHKAAQQLATRAENCVAFEDSEMGTRAAVSSGAQTVQVPDLIVPTDDLRKLGHLIVPTLIEGALAVGLVSSGEIN